MSGWGRFVARKCKFVASGCLIFSKNVHKLVCTVIFKTLNFKEMTYFVVSTLIYYPSNRTNSNSAVTSSYDISSITFQERGYGDLKKNSVRFLIKKTDRQL